MVNIKEQQTPGAKLSRQRGKGEAEREISALVYSIPREWAGQEKAMGRCHMLHVEKGVEERGKLVLRQNESEVRRKGSSTMGKGEAMDCRLEKVGRIDKGQKKSGAVGMVFT